MGNENIDNRLANSYAQIQKQEAKKTFYGEHDIISRPGFDSIESFDKSIKDAKETINDYESILLENQQKLISVREELDFFDKHPEIVLPNQIKDLTAQYDSLIDRKNHIIEKQEQEKKYLKEIMEAKKEFMREMRFVYKNQAKDKANLLKEYDAKQKEMKNLENKISMGMVTGLDKARYEALKNDIIPEMDKMLGINQEQEKNEEVSEEVEQVQDDSLENDEDQEIVNEEDGKEITKKEKFKNIAKKVAKVAAVVGGAALVAGAIYHFMKGDSTPITQIMHGVSDTMSQVANNTDPSHLNLTSTSVGDYANIFASNSDVMNGVNAMTPNSWASDQIVGVVDANNVVTPAHTIGDIVNAQNQGIDVQSIAVGNGSFTEGNVSGFVDADIVNNVVGGQSR